MSSLFSSDGIISLVKDSDFPFLELPVDFTLPEADAFPLGSVLSDAVLSDAVLSDAVLPDAVFLDVVFLDAVL